MLTVFGAINVDFIFPLSRLPQPGDTLWSEGGQVTAGGKGLNQAIAAAQDRCRVRLFGAVGRDALADTALAGVARAGIDLAGIARLDLPTGRAAIAIAPDGHTLVMADRGANAQARAAQVPDAALARHATLLLQLDTDPAECAVLILRARRAGARVILNLSPSRLIDADALRAADLLIGNEEEIAWLGQRLATGNNSASVQAALGVAVVRMLGVQGAEATSAAGWLHMPAMPVDMRDTTVAGDCFVGVLAAALSRGGDLADALRRAAVAAALSTTSSGAAGSLPRAADIDAALPRAPLPSSRQDEVPD